MESWLNFFHSFIGFVEEIWEISKTDVPYVISCNIINTNNLELSFQSNRCMDNIQYEREEINCPLYFRATSESLSGIVNIIKNDIYNALGEEYQKE